MSCSRQRPARSRSLTRPVDTGTEVSDLVVGSAIAASFARLLAGKLIALHLPQENAASANESNEANK